MARLMALFSVLALLGSLAVFVYAAIRRYRGRPVARGTVRLAVGLLGAGHGFGFLYFGEPVALVPFLVAPAFATYWLLRQGLRVATGVMLIALALPAGLWWGYFVVQDLVDPIPLYDPILWLWWAPELVLVVVGATLVAGGDRPAPEPQLFERAASQIRDPAAVGNALLRSTMIGPIPLQLIAGMIPAMVGIGFALPLVVRAGVPSPLALVGATVLFAVVSVELGFVALPRRARAAFEGFAVLGNPEMKRWVAVTGTRVPTSVRAMRHWLDRNPDRPETCWARAQALIITGDLAAAHDVIERMPIPTDWDRFEQHALRVYLDWVEGGDPDFDALRVEAETVDASGSPSRLAARGTAMLAKARDLAFSGGDWMAPLIVLRDEAGPNARRMLREDQRRALYPALLGVGFILCTVELMAGGLIG